VNQTFQPSLLAEGVTEPDDSDFNEPLSDINRVQLGQGAWVDHLLGWVNTADRKFTDLRRSTDWRTEKRLMYDRVLDVPRLVAWFGNADSFPAPWLVSAMDQLNNHYVQSGDLVTDPLVSAGCCLYRSGLDSVAWHGDRIGRSRHHDTLVAIVSLGNPRTLRIRPTSGGKTLGFSLGHGDLLVMGGSAQRTHDHCVPKASTAIGPRISVQFRTQGVS
jgi:alkylated DNA repair dioxygenase AlkB